MNSDTEIVATTPAAAPAGPVVLVIQSPVRASTENIVFEYEAVRLPEIMSPPPGSVLATSDITFSWSANGALVEEWWLRLEHEDADVEMFEPVVGTHGNERSLINLPLDGRAVRAALYYRIAGDWAVSASNYVMATDPAFVQAKQQARPVFDQHFIPIDDSNFSFPADDDILVLIYGARAVALPASWNMGVVPVPGGPPIEPIPVAALPTIAKEGFYLVNVGGRFGLRVRRRRGTKSGVSTCPRRCDGGSGRRES